MRRSDAMGRRSEDRESCTPADGEARPCPAPTARHTSEPSRSAESSVHWPPSAPRFAGARRPWSIVKSSTAWTLFTPARELNGALAESDLSFEMFGGVHWCIFLDAVASAVWRRAPLVTSVARDSRHDVADGSSRPGFTWQHTGFSSSIALGPLLGLRVPAVHLGVLQNCPRRTIRRPRGTDRMPRCAVGVCGELLRSRRSSNRLASSCFRAFWSICAPIRMRFPVNQTPPPARKSTNRPPWLTSTWRGQRSKALGRMPTPW